MGKPIHPLTGDHRQILEEAKIPWFRVTLPVPTRFLAQGQRPGANPLCCGQREMAQPKAAPRDGTRHRGWQPAPLTAPK